MLGIDSHYRESLENKFMDLKSLWFADYLTTSPAEDDANAIQVTLFIRASKRIETLDEEFIRSKMYDHQLKSGGVATHLVEQVVYGGEFICSLQRSVDWNRETKESAQKSIYRAAKNYFTQFIGPNSSYCEPPAEIDDGVVCSVIYSLEDKHIMMGSTRELAVWLRDAVNLEKDGRLEALRPVDIVLRYIPGQVQVRVLFEQTKEDKFQMEKRQHKILKVSSKLSKQLDDAPVLLQKVIRHFLDLLPVLWTEIAQFYEEKISNGFVKLSDREDLKSSENITNLLIAITDWLNKRSQEVEMFQLLLKGTQFAMLTLPENEARMQLNNVTRTTAFVLKVEHVGDPLTKRIQKVIGVANQETVATLPVFPAVFAGMERLKAIRDMMRSFVDEANLSSDPANSHFIGLVPFSSPLEDGTIMAINSIQSLKI